MVVYYLKIEARETDAIMAEIMVCKSGELADDGVRIVQAGELEIGVIRYAGKYYAYRNLCPHQGGPACEGVRVAQIVDLLGPDQSFLRRGYDESDVHIVCPWHGYEYHLADGCHVVDRRIRLQKFNVTERDGEVYVTI